VAAQGSAQPAPLKLDDLFIGNANRDVHVDKSVDNLVDSTPSAGRRADLEWSPTCRGRPVGRLTGETAARRQPRSRRVTDLGIDARRPTFWAFVEGVRRGCR
jgi:hypothetical protein